MNRAEEFAERCYVALESVLPEYGETMATPRSVLLKTLAGSWLAFNAMLEQQTSREQVLITRHGFMKPTPEQVAAYLKEIGYDIDPEAFYDFYQQNGWKVGRSPMKDWKATCRNWKRNQWGNAHKIGQGVTQAASLGSLQVELERVREQISAIVRPGGAAHARSASSVSPEEMKRYQDLIARKESLEKRIREF